MTVEFLFSFVIAVGFFEILFRFCLSLTVIEVAQYIAFSTARAQMSSDLSPEFQTANARTKYAALLKNRRMANLFSNGWYKISSPTDIEIKNGFAGNDFNAQYSEPSGENLEDRFIPFIGVRLNLTAIILNFNVPFLGRTADSSETFTTKVTGFLFREPSQGECREFMLQRYQKILSLDSNSRFQKAAPFARDLYLPLEDNGC
jgi:hypothetical protein